MKLTNPLHGLSYTGTFVSSPFVHLAVTHHVAHWIVMGLSYELSLVDFFMLVEYFSMISYRTTPLLGLIGITALPIVFDIIGFMTPYLIDITYEPVGVAVFAVGVTFVYLDRFRAIQLASSHDAPIIVVSGDDRIRNYNTRARELFPTLAASSAVGEPLWAVVPDVIDALASDSSIIEQTLDGSTRYYRVSESPFGPEQAQLGRLIVFNDITDREDYGRELERQKRTIE